MSLPTSFELSALAMLAQLVHNSRYRTNLTQNGALDEALQTWDAAGHRLGQITAKQDLRQPPGGNRPRLIHLPNV